MLADFLTANRERIIARAQARVAARTSPKATPVELINGIPVFLDQLAAALRLARSTDVIDHDEIAASAGRHGADLLRMGLTIAQVVHDYGDVCQVVTELAVEERATIATDEFRLLNLCLDDAIAGAVTEYARAREHAVAEEGSERLGVFAHEIRNLLNSAILTFDSMKSGRVSVGGSTGLVHTRSLMGLRDLVNRSLADVRLDAGIERLAHISVADFIEEAEIGASMQAEARGLTVAFGPVARDATIEGDRPILSAVVSNLVQNAFKFTREHGAVSVSVRLTADRVFIDVEDECGGLPPGKTEHLFRPFQQKGVDRSGVGLGLTICLKAAKAHGGDIHVRDLPGKGCVFTLELPRSRSAAR